MSPFIKIVWSWPVLVLAILIGLLPLYGAYMPMIEGTLLPVTSMIQVIDPIPSGNGLIFRFAYTKLRACEFLGLEATKNGLNIDFGLAPGQIVEPGTRTIGKQLSQQWYLDAATLTGVSIYNIYRCSPFWITITKVYG